MADYLGSSGTLVSTALESIGYHYQSHLLDSLGTVLFGPVAVGLFVLYSIILLARFALTGKAKMVVWALVGPALFAGMLFNRTETKGSAWVFGTQPKFQAQVDYEVSNYLPASEPKTAKVSSFFANYTRMISSIVSSFVGIIQSTRPDIDEKFLIRAELATMVRSTTIEDAGLRLLLHDTFLRGCGDFIDLGQAVTDRSIPELVRREKAAEFSKMEAKEVALSDLPKDYVASLLARYTELSSYAYTGTTQSLAKWIDSGDRVIPSAIPEDNAELFASRKADAIRDIETNRKNILTCGQVWNFVYIGLYQTASLVQMEAVDRAPGIEENQLTRDLLEMRAAETPNGEPLSAADKANHLHYLIRVISSYILRNERNRPSGAAFMNSYSNKGFEFQTLKVPTESDLSTLERMRLKKQEWSNKTNIIATAVNLPYYQGLAIYFLEILFPFFAILLIIPGRQSGFLFWCLLWIWIKSWDIGFAVVMVLDDILYSIFTYWGHGKVAGSYGESASGMSPDLTDTLFALHNLDPTFQLSTYYSLIGAALGSVPILSSYLILGSVKGGAGIIAEGSQLMATQFASAAQFGQAQSFITGSKVEALEDERKNAIRGIAGSLIGVGDESKQVRQSAVTSNTGSGSPQNATGNQQFEDVDKKAKASGRAGGAAQGKVMGSAIAQSLPSILNSSPGAARTMRGFLDTVGGGVQTWGKFESALREAGKEREAAMLKAHLDVVSNSVPFNTFQEDRVRRMSAETRIYGGLEIPWTQREGGWGASLQKEVTSLTNQKIFDAAPYKAWEGVIKGFDGSTKGAMSLMIATAVNTKTQRALGSGNIADTAVAPPLHDGVYRSTNDSPRDGNLKVEFGISRAARSSSTGYIYPTNDGIVIYKGKLGPNGETSGAGAEDVILVKHRNNTITAYYGYDENDKLGVTENKEVHINNPIGVLKSREESVFFKAINSHFQWIEPKPLFSGLLPIKTEEINPGMKEFIIHQAEKYKISPYPDQ